MHCVPGKEGGCRHLASRCNPRAAQELDPGGHGGSGCGDGGDDYPGDGDDCDGGAGGHGGSEGGDGGDVGGDDPCST